MQITNAHYRLDDGRTMSVRREGLVNPLLGTHSVRVQIMENTEQCGSFDFSDETKSVDHARKIAGWIYGDHKGRAKCTNSMIGDVLALLQPFAN